MDLVELLERLNCELCPFNSSGAGGFWISVDVGCRGRTGDLIKIWLNGDEKSGRMNQRWDDGFNAISERPSIVEPPAGYPVI